MKIVVDGQIVDVELVWQKLWKIKAPPKRTNLIWSVSDGCLPSNYGLRRRLINCTSICLERKADEETSMLQSHVLWLEMLG